MFVFCDIKFVLYGKYVEVQYSRCGLLIERGIFKGQRGERNGASLLHQRHLRLTGLSSLNLQLVATGSARH